METLGSIRDRLINEIEDESPEMSIVFTRWINEAIGLLQKEYIFHELKEQHDETITSGVFQLPPLVDNRLGMFLDDGTTIPSKRIEFRGDVFHDNTTRYKRHWYTPDGLTTSNGTTKDVDIVEGSATVTRQSDETGWFAAGDVGKGLKVEGYPFVYRIEAVDTGANTVTIFPNWRGPDIYNHEAIADPMGMHKFLVYDGDDVLLSDDITLYYSMMHPPLYSYDDRLWIEAPETVKLYALKIAMRTCKYNVDVDRLRSDLEEAKRIELREHEKQIKLPQGMGGGSGPFVQSSRIAAGGLFKRD